jgi:hypothetical protein
MATLRTVKTGGSGKVSIGQRFAILCHPNRECVNLAISNRVPYWGHQPSKIQQLQNMLNCLATYIHTDESGPTK